MFHKGPNQFLTLLISLVALILVFPVVDALGFGGWIFEMFSSGILLSAVYAVSERRGSFVVTLLLAAPALVATWVSEATGWLWLDFLAKVLSVVALMLVVGLLLAHVLKSERVNKEKIFAALSAYLLIGFIWALLFGIVEFLLPGSFRLTGDQVADQGVRVYYSFVTLTTLGYGDIVPITGVARSLAVLEALIGQLYLTVLVARLVGLYIAYSSKN
jgi:hypothetical protein